MTILKRIDFSITFYLIFGQSTNRFQKIHVAPRFEKKNNFKFFQLGAPNLSLRDYLKHISKQTWDRALRHSFCIICEHYIALLLVPLLWCVRS